MIRLHKDAENNRRNNSEVAGEPFDTFKSQLEIPEKKDVTCNVEHQGPNEDQTQATSSVYDRS